MLPSIFGENLFDDMFNTFGMFPDIDRTLYGKHARNLMKTDVRETESTYELDVDLPGFKKDEIQVELAHKGGQADKNGKQGQHHEISQLCS